VGFLLNSIFMNCLKQAGLDSGVASAQRGLPFKLKSTHLAGFCNYSGRYDQFMSQEAQVWDGIRSGIHVVDGGMAFELPTA
jgi:hypothetical protein